MILGYVIGGLLVLVIMPLAIYFLTALADKLFRIEIIQNNDLKLIIAVILLITGFSFGLSSIIFQNIIGKGGPVEISGVEISPKTKNLVTTGPYRYTRNPMLFGTFLIYFAEATLINSITAFFIVAMRSPISTINAVSRVLSLSAFSPVNTVLILLTLSSRKL